VLTIPIIGIISKANFEISYFFSFFENKYNIRLIYITFFQAFLSSILSCILAIPFALSLARHKHLKIVKFIISLCGYAFVLPSILIVYGVIGIFGTNGFLNNLINFYNIFDIKTLFGLKAIILAHILLNAPFATRLFFQNLNSIPSDYVEISKSLSIGFWGHTIKIEWPILKQNIFSIFSIIFVLCFLSFAIVMALGGGPSTSTLEVAIYQSALFELNFNKAIYLSVIQIIICLIFLLMGFGKLKGSNYFIIKMNNVDQPYKKNYLILIYDYCILTIFSLFLFSPIVYILINFINKLYLYDFFFHDYFLNAFINSLILSFSTSSIVTLLGVIISLLLINLRKKILLQQLLFLISSFILIISPIILSLGYFIFLGELRYINSIIYIVVIIINCIFLIPFSILILFTRLKNIFLNFEDLKKSFQISEINFIQIILPLFKKNIFYVFAFTTAISFGDFTVISFFKNESFQTIPTLLYKLIASYRFEEASFVAGFLLLLSFLIYALFDNLFYRDKPDKSI
jgi:thiamine transport system permease protein|tara:strand:- start:3663 stop:5210 length:1548 start_codon:yes stop_codon:yes gene_type:complete